MNLFFDTETTDMPPNGRLIQLGAILDTPERETIATLNTFVAPYYEEEVSAGAFAVHGISKEKVEQFGINIKYVLNLFSSMISLQNEMKDTKIIAHNLNFDWQIIKKAFCDTDQESYILYSSIFKMPSSYCTMLSSADLCQIPGKYGRYKWPTLQELYEFLFGEKFENAHDAMADVQACRRCYYKMIDLKNEQQKRAESWRTVAHPSVS